MQNSQRVLPTRQDMSAEAKKGFKDLLQWQIVSGQPLSVKDFTLTPQSRLLIARFPWGAFVWQRPTAVLIEHNGQVERLPIVDLTRTIQLGLLGLGGLIIFIVGLVQLARRRKERIS